MQKIRTVADLKCAIQHLEYLQNTHRTLLKEHFHVTFEKIKPINIIKNKFKEMVMAPSLKTTLVNAAIGFTTGVVAKKIIVGNSHNPITKLLGVIVQMVVASKVTKNADAIKTAGNVILEKINPQHNNSEPV